MVSREPSRRQGLSPVSDAAREELDDYGGEGSGEGQGEYGGDGYSAMGDFTDGETVDQAGAGGGDPEGKAAQEREVNPDLGFQNRHDPIPNTHQP